MTELPPFNNPPPRPGTQPAEGPPGQSSPSAANEQPVEPDTRDRWRGLRTLSAWILRWALLGAGVGGAWLFGILVAQFFPATNPEPPLQEVVTRKTSRFVQKVGSLPEWWNQDSLAATPAPLQPVAAPAPTAEESARPVALSEAEREQVTIELQAIFEEMQRLRDRTSAVERQLGLPTVEMPLEERIAAADNRLSPPTESPPPEMAPAQPTLQPSADKAVDPLFQVNAYRVTLPSDVLFAASEATLQANAQPLLDSILQDIGRYPDATILVGSYTDVETDSSTPTELSYQQALAVRRYLSQRLGDNTLHWVAVGYGNSPIGSTGSVQLSRRITIAIVP